METFGILAYSDQGDKTFFEEQLFACRTLSASMSLFFELFLLQTLSIGTFPFDEVRESKI